ncbi:MAG: LPS export ABC transporter periplasmic protein LptC [Halothiobacillaceae bacterium]
MPLPTTLPRTLLWPVLLVAVLVTGWWNFHDSAQEPAATGLPEVDHSLSGFHAAGFDETGALAWRLQGEQVDHLLAEKTFRMGAVTVEYHDQHDPGHPPWRIEATAGESDDRLERIVLFDGVRADRDAAPPVQALSFATQRLTIEPDAGLAYTEASARAAEAGVWTSRSRGLRLEREAARIGQESVRDRYRPPHDGHPPLPTPDSPAHQGISAPVPQIPDRGMDAPAHPGTRH